MLPRMGRLRRRDVADGQGRVRLQPRGNAAGAASHGNHVRYLFTQKILLGVSYGCRSSGALLQRRDVVVAVAGQCGRDCAGMSAMHGAGRPLVSTGAIMPATPVPAYLLPILLRPGW